MKMTTSLILYSVLSAISWAAHTSKSLAEFEIKIPVHQGVNNMIHDKKSLKSVEKVG